MASLLYNRTCYSLLESSLRVTQLVEFAKENSYTSVAITDHNVMHGHMLFRKACTSMDIKPIFGLEVDVEIDESISSMLLYAKNDEGYSNLIRCSSELSISSSALDLEKLCSYSKECVVIIPTENCPFTKHLELNEWDIVKNKLLLFKGLFDDLYISISNPLSSFQREINDKLLDICSATDVEVVAATLSLYANESDHESYKVLCALKQNMALHNTNLRFETNRHLLPLDVMKREYNQKCIENTEIIASKCNVEFKHNKAHIPSYECPNNASSSEYLRGLCIKGLQKRFDNGSVPKKYVDRIEYELKVITEMGFSDYFLIVWDFILFARRNGIYVGPGRGSAAASMVAYCLGITHLDPINYHLLFERFLNPERITMPDIDIDFPDNRRDEVIEYVKQKYGKDRIAHIVTFGTMGAKQALRDIGRILDFTTRDIDLIAKAVPNVPKITLKGAYESSDRFRQVIQAHSKYLKLYELACGIEGIPRHLSTHAAGIVMSNDELTKTVPLIELEENTIATQYSMEYLEDLGLLKMDFLGLRNLTIIDEIVRDINTTTPLDIMKISLEDDNTFELIRNVDTVGIFQLESDGMKSLIKKMQPTKFDDIATTIALFRPGPMENIPEFLRRRSDNSLVKYPHNDVKWILEDTYGIMVYQEQILLVSQVMAGFSLGKADILRSAMSKKKEKELRSLQEDFIAGCLKNGYSLDIAKSTYEYILKFASYGFNRAHSVSYALIAYQLAFLKANYPLYFYKSILNSVIISEAKTYEYILECRKKNINILPPNINTSTDRYFIEGDGIRFPLTCIKNVGNSACEQLLSERNANGNFVDYIDFVVRASRHRIGKNIFESLINSGVLDCFKQSRTTMKLSLASIIKYADLVKFEAHGQTFFDLDAVSAPVLTVGKDNPQITATKEKETLGFYFGTHPIEQIKNKQPYKVLSLFDAINKKGEVSVFIEVTKVKQHRTKNGVLMCFVSGSDETADYDFVFMPLLYQQNQQDLQKGNYLYIEGNIDKRDSCLVKKMIKYEVETED